MGGLDELSLDGGLVETASLRASDMAERGYFSHVSPNGETAFSLMEELADVPWTVAAENIARNNYPDDQAVEVTIRAFMSSEGHRRNILNGNLRRAGVAVVADASGMHYLVVVFSGD